MPTYLRDECGGTTFGGSIMNRVLSFRRAFIALGLTAASVIMGQSVDGGSVVNGLPNNTLTAAEEADGYKLLWNGKDFTGWGVNNPADKGGAPGSNWAIVNLSGLEKGAKKSLSPDSNMLEVAAAGFSLFTTDNTWGDFDWKMEWQAVVAASGNAGMLYHYRIDASTDNNLSAPEYQLCNKEWTSEWTDPLTTAGCDYDMLPLLPQAKNADRSPSWLRAEGHWNQSRVISFGPRTAHYGNGMRLMEYQMFSAEWTKAYDVSKYKPKQGSSGVYAKLHAGSFYIQDHGQKWMKFRNIRAKRLTQNPWGPTSPYLNKEASAKGDTSLVDALTFSDDLFPAVTAITPYTIVPKTGTRIVANGDGLSVQFSQPGNYRLTIDDVRGESYLVRKVHGSSFFLPGTFSHRPRILTIWEGDKKIQESVIGVR